MAGKGLGEVLIYSVGDAYSVHSDTSNGERLSVRHLQVHVQVRNAVCNNTDNIIFTVQQI